MEAILIGAAAQYLIPIIGTLLVALAAWGISVLKSKVNSENAKNALDEVGAIVQTVVGGLSQTTAQAMKDAAADGKLTGSEKTSLKLTAINKIKNQLSDELVKHASQAVNNLDSYISEKIEDCVLRTKQ